MKELSLHILDLAQNSVEAGARKLTIVIDEDLAADRLTITITDDGAGMDAETVRRVVDPFVTTRTTRRFGLGLPLLDAATQRCAGRLVIQSAPGQGTKVAAEFQHSHIDRAPLGDLGATLATIIAANPELELDYRHRIDGRSFQLSTRELRARVGEIPLSHPEIILWIREYVAQELQQLRGGV